ncbi:hypothetical protein QE152_g29604 [Popillia japonica]|uniref:Retroviral polymerase SH3-like domain-containing protein n=1 Tax=Popillia japonica TaxID=7064 RepID=A0AAW1JGR6_POPJA
MLIQSGLKLDFWARFNQTLFDTARCMLIQSGLKLDFWAEAIMTACYIRNRCPTDANEGVAPIARWKNGANNIGHLRVFGCKAWAANKFRLSKLSPKGMPCIFIGCDENAKAYRFYDDVKDKFFISRDVKFAEDVFPMRQQEDELLNWKLTQNIVTDETKEVSIPIPTEEELHFLGNGN